MIPVTVLMAVYNGEQFLGEAMDSILQQSYADYEFLILNDGSTDRTREIVLSYQDPRIRLLDNESNIGLARSLNRGIVEAKGALIARQDADDVSHPQRLAIQVSYLQQHPEVALLGSWYEVIDSRGNPVKKNELPCSETDIRWALFFYCPFVHTSVVFKKEVSTVVGHYDETLTYSMDYELWRRIADRKPIANLSEHLVKLRIHGQSMTSTSGEQSREGYKLRLDTLASLLNWKQMPPPMRQCLFDRMLAFQSPYPTVVPLQLIPNLFFEFWRLHRKFCRMYNLSIAEALHHRQKLFRQLTWNLGILLKQRASTAIS